MPEAYIVSAVRTPVGRRGGSLSRVHPADLAGHILKAAVERSGVTADLVEDVILGCVDQLGAQSPKAQFPLLSLCQSVPSGLTEAMSQTSANAILPF